MERSEGGYPLLARWATEFDCGHETNWWYVIKDDVFNVEKLKAKRRYEIRKGKRYFFVKRINPLEWKDALLRIQIAAFDAYPPKYRPHIEEKAFLRNLEEGVYEITYGVFCKQEDSLCGYARLSSQGKCLNFTVMKTMPEYERYAINAALVCGILEDKAEFLACGGYICDGTRNINHETAFQDYLEKYFGFRKAYCRLHIVYRPFIGPIITILYPFRKIFAKIPGKLSHNVASVLMMESICREEQKCEI